MKNLFIITIALVAGLNSFGQNTTEFNTDKPELECDIITFDTATNVMEFSGNVNFKTDIIELQNADKIILNKETNEIIVSGTFKYTFDGTIQIPDNSENKIMRYKIGERIAYLE